MKREKIPDLSAVEILVDLQTGTISMVLPVAEDGLPIELEAVCADDEFAPKE